MVACAVIEAVLAIDLGTSATKVLMVDRSGTVLGRQRITHSTAHPSPDTGEQDPDEWWGNLRLAIRNLLDATGSETRVAAITVTGQMHGLVLHDAHGHATGPAITWQDRRSAETLPALLDRLPDDHPARTGERIAPGYLAATWHWLTSHHPERVQDARHVLLPKDEMVYRLTGEYVTDPSDAIGTGLYDIDQANWDAAVAEAASLPPDILPRIVPSGGVAGQLTAAGRDLGLEPGIPVIIAGGDAAVGAFGAGATDPDRPLLLLSTGCQLLQPIRDLPEDVQGVGQIWPSVYPPGMAQWLRVGATLNGGSAIGWARATFGGFDAPVTTAPDASRTSEPVFVPYLTGERFPTMQPDAAGAFFGITTATDRSALLRAAINGVALATADALVSIGGDIATAHPMLVGGGGTRDDDWLGAISRIFARPLHVVTEPDLSVWGAARLAAAHLGWLDPLSQPEEWSPPIREIDPVPNETDRARARLERYRALARAVPGPMEQDQR